MPDSVPMMNDFWVLFLAYARMPAVESDFGSAFEVDEDGSVWVMLFGELNGFGGDAVVGAAASIP